MHLKVFVKVKKTLKTLSSGQKTQKTPKNPKNPKKTTGLGFFKKTRVFSNPAWFRSLFTKSGSGTRFLMTKNWKKKHPIFFYKKDKYIFSWASMQDYQVTGETSHPLGRTSSYSRHEFLHFFLLLYNESFFAFLDLDPHLESGSGTTDPVEYGHVSKQLTLASALSLSLAATRPSDSSAFLIMLSYSSLLYLMLV